ncbi:MULTISPECIES: hypothetical protein [Amycolatopsis]|uniref:hypothetical protein n=1 Tax=Amycolatopsis TaxID=1813 RepID=UPI002104E832|nr:hypothetical protein [Amycolatopsis sp. TNS106]
MRLRALFGALVVSIIGIGANVATANGVTETAIGSSVPGIENSIYYPIVRQNALYHSEDLVRVAAWQALRSDEGEPALRAFVRTGFFEARKRAEGYHARNKEFARRVMTNYSAQYSPNVHAEATAAYKGSSAQQEQFFRTGFAAAKALDDAAREADEQHKQQILDQDRAFVRLLAEFDPGEQVRLAAQHALRAGGTDSHLRAFFASEWMAAAATDVEVYRIRTQEAGVRFYALIPQLIADAEEAEREALAAEGAAAEQARAVAARAWATTREKADEARAVWESEALACAEQARYWRTVIDRANASVDPVWAMIATRADKNRAGWAADGTFADGQTQYWASVEKHAKEHRDQMSPAG